MDSNEEWDINDTDNEESEEENEKQEDSDGDDIDDNDDYVETGPVTREHFDFIKMLGNGGEFSCDVLTLYGSSNKLLKRLQCRFETDILNSPYGTVFLVKKNCGIDKGTIYAVKVIKKDAVVETKKSITHVKAEQKVLKLLRGCPYIPNLHYSFQTADKLFIVQDYVPGGEMFTLLQKGVLDEKRVRFYVAELVIALEHIHKHDIVYRDIKLENILIDADGHIKLVDFGLCKQLRINRRAYTFCGTPEYMAPEVFSGKGHDTAADWWALGVLTIELLTGVSAFGHVSRHSQGNEIMKRVTSEEPIMPKNISHEMKDFILKMLNKDPRKRLGNQQLATDIKNHPLFYGMDWNKLEKKELAASYKPTIKGPLDVQNFSDEFTSKTTDIVPSGIPKNTFLTFKGYSYIAPELEPVDSHDLDSIHESLKVMSLQVFNDRQPKSTFFQKYNFTSDKPIGYGTTSVCMKCESVTNNNVYAVKVYQRKDNCDTQIEVLRQCAAKKCSGIVELIEVITDAKWTYLVMEFIDGVNLLQHLNNRSFNGEYVCEIFVALSKIVKQVHSLKYSHGRVCFKNIRCTKNSADIRLIGFSYAQKMTDIIDRHVDFWSISVCLYTLLCGHSPFQMLPSNIAEMAKSIQDNTFNKESTAWTQLHEETRSLIDKLFRSTISNLTMRNMKSIVNEKFSSALKNAELINENQEIISIRTIKKKTSSEVSEEENDGLPVLVKNSVLNGDTIMNGNNSIESADLRSPQQKSRNGKDKSRGRNLRVTPQTQIISHEISSTKSLSTSTKSKRINEVNASKRRTKSPKLTDKLSARKMLEHGESGAKVQLENIRETRRNPRKGDITTRSIKGENCDASEAVDVKEDLTPSSPDPFKYTSSARGTDKVKKEAVSRKSNATKAKLQDTANVKPGKRRRSKSSTLKNTIDESKGPPSAKSRRTNNVNASTRRTKSTKFTDELSAQNTLDQQVRHVKSGAKVQLENIRETRRNPRKGDITTPSMKVENCDSSEAVDVKEDLTPSSPDPFKYTSSAVSRKSNATKAKLQDMANVKPGKRRRSKSSTLTENTTNESMDPQSVKSRRINNVNASARRTKSPTFTDQLSAQNTLDQQDRNGKSGAKVQLQNIRETRRKFKKGDIENCDTSKVIDAEKDSTPKQNLGPVRKSPRIPKPETFGQNSGTSKNSINQTKQADNNVQLSKKPSSSITYVTYTSTAKECVDQRVQHLELGVREHKQFGVREHKQFVFIFPLRKRVRPSYTFQRFDYK